MESDVFMILIQQSLNIKLLKVRKLSLTEPAACEINPVTVNTISYCVCGCAWV